ncbi:NTPase [Streptococcus oralis subsp. tigurinus]|uniref:NTPase n=1 Tax=Streptococcus oralis subsp. tigurinus TaxID=1077464 RepID=A0A1X1FVQ8_STROR|nr:P-loop NTPase fold protein [Streptococcus oralis]ORO38440.1 NTPase [Streptococcus oralis subsp. tigurinus]
MKNIMTRILNFLLNFKLLKRPSWSSNVRIVEWYKIFIASIWVLYLALEIEQFKRFVLPIYKFVSNYNILKAIISMLYENRVIILLALTIPTILFWFLDIIFKKVSYKKLDPNLFPEYDLDDYPFQTHLVEFLNNSDSIHNVFWLDGSWGSGKTFFIKTFFENQIYKKKEIYYISCFGIKTREQAEKILISEIEKQSILGNLDFIPLVGGVFKWFFKTVGTDLMKRDSIIIFDDFERVSYTETSDNPSDYNDLLGYIDYLSENKRFKIIVILNSEEIKSTKKNLIDNKFKLNQNQMISTEEVIDNILKKSNLRDDDLGKILSLIFKIYYADIEERVAQDKNKRKKVEKLSLRSFQKSLEEISMITEDDKMITYILDCINGWGITENILKSLLKSFALEPKDYYLFFEMILKLPKYYDNFDTKLEKDSIEQNMKKNENISFQKKSRYFLELLQYLWRKGKTNKKFRNLGVWEGSDQRINSFYTPNEIEKVLIEIYYDIVNNNTKNNYQIEDIDTLKSNEEYQYFIKNRLVPKLKTEITINDIPLERFVKYDNLFRNLYV